MVIVISNPTPITCEHQILHQLFDEGLDVFHIYKPSFSEEQTEDFIRQIPSEYHNRIVLHSRYFKFHSLTEVQECKENYNYAFLSPIFDSISKKGYKSKFDLKEVKVFLQRHNNCSYLRKNGKRLLIALGGIDEDKIDTVNDLGFSGIALLGAIWQNKNPVEKFKRIKEKWEKKEFVY